MPIHRLPQTHALNPDHIALMVAAHEGVCAEFGIRAHGDDLVVKMIAKAIVDCAQRGIRDPAMLRQCARDAVPSL